MEKLVNIVKAARTNELSDQINQFQIDYPVNIIDIQYQASQKNTMRIDSFQGTDEIQYDYEYSALIIYKYSVWKEIERWMNGIKQRKKFTIFYNKNI